MAVWLVGGFLAVAVAAVAPGYFWVNARKAAAEADVPVTVRRHVAIWRWSGITLGALAALVTAVSGTLGVGLMLSAPVFGASSLPASWLASRAAYTVTGACGVFVTVPLIASSLITAAGLLGISCRPNWWTATAWTLLALVPVWTALLVWSGLAVLAPPRQNLASTSL